MKKNIFYWGLYDFANSVLTASLVLFFSQWVIIENKFPDFAYGITFSMATLVVLLLGPFFGAWSDKLGKRNIFIFWLTLITGVAALLLGFVTPSTIPPYEKVILALVLFFIIQIGYQLSLIFFNSLLENISKKENRGLISGIGELLGNIGWILGALALLPVANGNFNIIQGVTGRSQVFLPAAIFFILLSVPLVFLFKEKAGNPKKVRMDLKSIYSSFSTGLKSLIKKDRNVTIFLIAFYFISDAMLTIQQFFAIYFSEVWNLSDSMKVLLLSFLFIGAIPGAYFSGILCHRISVKKLLLWICVLINVIIFALTIAPPQKYLLYFLILSMGIGWGSFYTVARTLFVNISPKNRMGEYFGFYSVFQRFASFIGPLIWSLSIFVFSKSLIKYQITVFLLAIMMAIGIFIMMRVEEKGSGLSKSYSTIKH